MKKILIACLAVIGVVIVIALLMRTPTQTETTPPEGQTSATTPTGGSAAQTGTFTNKLVVGNQKPGSTITIASVTLSQPGYVVIRGIVHNGTAETPGTVLANSTLLPKGVSSNVVIKMGTSPGSSYFAQLQLDSGDKKFNAIEDVVAFDAAGHPFVVRFTADTPITSSPSSHTVEMKSFAFAPASLTVKQGDLVLFTNKDNTIHTVTATAFGGRNLVEIGKSYSLNTAKLAKGTYNYKCDFHTAMTGTLIVQ